MKTHRWPDRARRRAHRAAGTITRRIGQDAAGFTLVEILVTATVLGLLLLLGLPNLWRVAGQVRIELACAEVVTALRTAQVHSFRHSQFVGLKFWTGGKPVRWGVYRDGDTDGVRTSDIRSGVDPLVMQERPSRRLGNSVWFGFPAGLVPRDPGDPTRRLDRLHDPIRFGRSDIATFSHLGTSSPGSLYLTNGYHLAAVRVTNRSGRVRILHYDRKREVWR